MELKQAPPEYFNQPTTWLIKSMLRAPTFQSSHFMQHFDVIFEPSLSQVSLVALPGKTGWGAAKESKFLGFFLSFYVNQSHYALKIRHGGVCFGDTGGLNPRGLCWDCFPVSMWVNLISKLTVFGYFVNLDHASAQKRKKLVGLRFNVLEQFINKRYWVSN